MAAQIKVYTTSEAETKHFRASSGNAYTTFSDAMVLSDGTRTSGPKQYMIKTSGLDEFLEVVTAARDAWRKAKDVEKTTNARAYPR